MILYKIWREKMNENGFTGLNPYKAKHNIESFLNSAGSIQKKITLAFDEFTNELKKAWASPKAVEVATEHFEKIRSINDDFYNELVIIANKACNAYNAVANANGVGTISINPHRYSGNAIAMLTDNINGVVGMNVEVVRNQILPKFEKVINQACNEIDSLPTSIELYDDENGISHAYTSNINVMKERIISAYDSMVASVKIATFDEINNVLLAKQNATSTLNG